ncbi:Bacteroides conjugation system ATPase, TraG family [Chitinophaga jiangningensis]|uniref:Bacteroides conjugation system ATPase, TraG family n=1 Tax=Chitinophaga jiangningensis TaxID=1419482 RepID=A0A1M7A3H6_9BACT|nr:TraG family conjugative transposon ATPase [Chitinophaga jiangningensis]SHL37301.1 Bacteroides conjugation system ATPase, TraG family [Chitinophaga jiangningensis]
MRTKSLEDVFPIAAVENDCLISTTGSITVAYEIQLPEVFTMDNADYEAIHVSTVRAIRSLPAHTVLHKSDWFFRKEFMAPNSENSTVLSCASDMHFNERPYFDHKCYLFISSIPGKGCLRSPILSSLITGSIMPSKVLEDKTVTSWVDQVQQFASILQEGDYLKLRKLTAEELVGSESKAGIIEQYSFLLPSEKEYGLSDIQLNPLKIGDRQVVIYSIADAGDLPRFCGPKITYDRYSTDKTKFSISFSAGLNVLLLCNHIYNQYIIVGDSAEVLSKLEKKRLRLQSLSAYSRENTISKDATNNFLNEAIGKGRLPVKAHFNIIAWADEVSTIREVKNAVASAIASLNAAPREETAAPAFLYWAGIPGNGAEIPSTAVFDTFAEQASCFLNTETNYRTSISTNGIRLTDRISGLPLQVDLFHLPFQKNIIQNRNIFCLGPSGSGKSFATNHILRSAWEAGAHIVVVDVGHSYRGLCELAGGYYFTFSEKDPIRFNPFFLGEASLHVEKRESIKSLLLALWKKDDESYTRSEYISLSNALTGYYNYLPDHPDLFPCFNSFYDYLQTDFLHNIREQAVKLKDFDIDNFLYVLRPYYLGGEYDYLLNSRENLDLLDTRFIVFELDNIQNNAILFSVTTLILTELFISKMRLLPGIHKVILIEEAWKAIAKAGMAEYLRYLFKTVRKFYGTAAVVTQEVNDIISSPIIKDTIIASSDIRILLDQSKYQNKFQDIQNLLGLTDKEVSLIMSMNKNNDPRYKYKEIFIGLGAHSKVYRTEVSLEEYLCYTTEEKEKVKVQAYAAKYGSIKRGIAMLAKDIRDKSI